MISGIEIKLYDSSEICFFSSYLQKNTGRIILKTMLLWNRLKKTVMK